MSEKLKLPHFGGGGSLFGPEKKKLDLTITIPNHQKPRPVTLLHTLSSQGIGQFADLLQKLVLGWKKKQRQTSNHFNFHQINIIKPNQTCDFF